MKICRKSIYGIMFLLIICRFSDASTLSQILAKFDARTSELDTAEAFYSQDMAIKWFNMAQHKIADMGKYNEFYKDYPVKLDSAVYSLPSAFSSIKEAMLYVDGRWHPIVSNRLVQEQTQNTTRFSVSWEEPDSAKLVLIFGDLIELTTAIAFKTDSILYHLPKELTRVLAVMIWSSGEWESAIPLYPFRQDSLVYQYVVAFEKTDTAAFYLHERYRQQQTEFAYRPDSLSEYTLPAGFRWPRSVMVKANTEWYPIGPYDPANPDTVGNTQYSISWYNPDSAEVVIIPGNLLEVTTEILYKSDSVLYHLPEAFNSIKSVMIWINGEWETALPVYPFQDDTAIYQYYVAFENTDTAALYLHDVYGDQETDITFDFDSASYTLPANFRRLRGVMVRSLDTWFDAFENPYFKTDTNVVQYFVAMHDLETAVLYLKVPEDAETVTDGDIIRVFYEGLTLKDNDSIRVTYFRKPAVGDTIQVCYDGLALKNDDSIRVVYLRRAKDGDSLRVIYSARVTELDSVVDTCTFPQNVEVFIIEEMLTYYEQARKNYQVQQVLWQETRTDMGVVKPRGESIEQR